jgi:hypothetical protein
MKMIEVGKFKKIIAIVVLVGSSTLGFAQQVPDQLLKKNVAPLQNALASVQQLEPKRFEYNTNRYTSLNLPTGQQYGFLSENVQQVLPELVRLESHSYRVGKNTSRSATIQTTDLESLVPLLVAAIKEQQEQINELKRQLSAQEK